MLVINNFYEKIFKGGDFDQTGLTPSLPVKRAKRGRRRRRRSDRQDKLRRFEQGGEDEGADGGGRGEGRGERRRGECQQQQLFKTSRAKISDFIPPHDEDQLSLSPSTYPSMLVM